MPNAVLSKLRALVTRAEPEHCDECGDALKVEREPLLQPDARRVVRVCAGCAEVLSGRSSGARYLRVRRRAERLTSFQMPEQLWLELEVPVGLAFFRVRGRTGEVVATFPGRAGLIESFAPLRAWQGLEQLNPELKLLAPDVEALLLRRTARHQDYFLISIDHGYELVNLLRSADGAVASPELAIVQSFIARLAARSEPPKEA